MEGTATGTVADGLRLAARLLRDDPALAAEQAREVLKASPRNADASRLLGAALRRTGEDEAAERAELDAIEASIHDPALMRAAEALLDNDLPVAEDILRPRLHDKPTDVAAIRMMAELAARIGRLQDAEHLLRRALELAPAFAPARANLATVLYKQNRPAEAIAALALLEGQELEANQNLQAAALGRIGAYEEAIALYEAVLQRFPEQAKVWMSYGHLLKTVGRQADSLTAYRRALAIAPGFGEVWWSLANLKTVRFEAADVAAMEAALGAPDLSEEDRLHLHFALGKALEDQGEAGAAFAHYADGNRLRRGQLHYDPEEISSHVRRSIALFTPDLFAAREGMGCPAPDPIFILGMPRAGSTLVEQILASHPAIEGTEELFVLLQLAGELAGGHPGQDPARLVQGLSEQDFHALGARYLDLAARSRRTDRPFFTDKNPYNWRYTGLIHAMLPNARIVDVRRNPMDCCFANYAQHFQVGANFSYDQRALGEFYSDYVRTMRHFDQVLPGRIHRVIHEDLVDNFETEVERLLDYLGLPFDERCLRYYETERPVHTPSSEQVRQPINRSGLGKWRNYERHLGPLIDSLGDLPRTYRE
jgi:tetratricopeptide (TPR) repeat protein